jgi:3',5'-cyclic AMP phosphodiesterase CpdA
MTSILHISDLHLGPPEHWQYIDDHKSKIAGAAERRAQKDVLRETIASLFQDGTLDEVGVVIVSGDLTNRAGDAGFDEFVETMQPLLTHVAPENFVVVPGNHDVPWEPGPGDPDRYKGFLRATRALGFTTPLLDREDFDATGHLKDNEWRLSHLVSGEDFVILPINSSHFCWGQEPLSSEAAEELLTTDDSHLADAVQKLRRHDVARVSNAQISALLMLLREQDSKFLAPRSGDDRVRIAVLHHQLLPVSSREEIKSFESLTNLGAIRELFAELGIAVALHGHKHESALYWDYIADQRSISHPPHRVLVSAAPGEFKPRLPCMRILRIGERPEARDLQIDDVVAAATPAGAARRDIQRARLWRTTATDDVTDAMTLHGATVAEVYAQLQSVFEGRKVDEPLYDLMCEITEPDDADQVPPGYAPAGILDVQQWMKDFVRWWQLRDPQLLQHGGFNHGHRVYRRWGNQVNRAADTLKPSPSRRNDTTRAVILLLDPQTEGGGGQGEFPSFVLVQLQLVREGHVSRLDCTGYFRKQEMRYWWPINVAELAMIQQDVLGEINSEDHHVRRGVLRTIAAYAAVEERLPTAALTAVDRAVDQRREDLWLMAYGLKHAAQVEKSELRTIWERYLAELQPQDDDPNLALPISHRGLDDVGKILSWLGSAEEPVAQALDELVRFYRLLDEQGSGRPSKTAVEDAKRHLAKLRSELDAALGPASQ